MNQEAIPATAAATTGIRYAEKRRTATCSFADRVAQCCVDHYQRHVPVSFRETQKQTCLAGIVAFFQDEKTKDGDHPLLLLLGMGVGTKFLSEEVLQDEWGNGTGVSWDSSSRYGRRVRDCHAEVLARKAFHRQLLTEIRNDLRQERDENHDSDYNLPTILERVRSNDGTIRYQLKSGVSLHMYASSAPCGNATFKKFATMKTKGFRDDLKEDQWPEEEHEPIHGHSIALGQFALLVKKDPGSSTSSKPPDSIPTPETMHNTMAEEKASGAIATKRHNTKNEKKPTKEWPAHQTTDWCPPGTSTVWSEEGSLHTCSDKLCRWNVLGLQGALLGSILQQPLYMSTLVVGRKFTECICRRAVCCRAEAKKKNKKSRDKPPQVNSIDQKTTENAYSVHHPAIMQTGVYMDEHGVIEMNHGSSSAGGAVRVSGQDVRFHSALSWVWWPLIGTENNLAESIDGATGFGVVFTTEEELVASNPTTSSEAPEERVSSVSTAALLDLFLEIKYVKSPEDISLGNLFPPVSDTTTRTLSDLRHLKKRISPAYEEQKETLLTKHPLFRQWKRREKSCCHPS